MDISADDTLPDDAWKDSFDKLLDQRPILRELKIIQKDVRASFNINSSYENSSYENRKEQQIEAMRSLPVAPRVHYLDVPKKAVQHRTSKVVSTPVRNITSSNPFKCTLSPIESLHLRHFKLHDKNENEKDFSVMGFNATPIAGNVPVNIEYIESLSGDMVEKVTDSYEYLHDISPLTLVRNKWKTRRSQKQVHFGVDNLSGENKKAKNFNRNVEILSPLLLKVNLQPGKWRKSLNSLRRTQNSKKENYSDLNFLKTKNQIGRSTTAVDRSKSLPTGYTVAGKRKSIVIRKNSKESRLNTRSTYSLGCNDFKRQLLQCCGQRRILTFKSAYNDFFLRNCCKIGEGVFGEVFIYSKPNVLRAKNYKEKTVLKIIPIEGQELVNGEPQKSYEQILPEIIISMELSALNDNNRKTNITSGFVNLQRVRCVKGQYPLYLQKLWEDYDLKKKSENDHPKYFTSNQQYVVLELEYGGEDLERFYFKNAEQSFAALQQIVLTLAVAEKEYQFEHRDLHWGNVLVLNTTEEYIEYKLEGKKLTIPTKGIKITIIDYTLSRMTFSDICFYNDLSSDEELFTAIGDYQFEIYRMMRKALNNKWETFEPKTNIFWISYIISKLVEGVTYTDIRSKNHLTYLDRFRQLQTSILTYTSCANFSRDLIT